MLQYPWVTSNCGKPAGFRCRFHRSTGIGGKRQQLASLAGVISEGEFFNLNQSGSDAAAFPHRNAARDGPNM